jgi:hypothetical protein
MDGFFNTQNGYTTSFRAGEAVFGGFFAATIQSEITGEIVPYQEKDIWKGNMKWKDAKKIIFQNMEVKNCYKAMKVNVIKDKRGYEVIGKQEERKAGEYTGYRFFRIKNTKKDLLHGVFSFKNG